MQAVLDKFDLPVLKAALRPERDDKFDLHGLQTLYDRYLLRSGEDLLELPQTFFMRVAMQLAVDEDNPTERAIEFYGVLSRHDFMCSTPTLFNAGTPRPQMSSCFLTTVDDSIEGIFKSIKDNALLSKFSGGLGNDWSRIRSLGSHIKGTNGISNGVVPFLKVQNSTTVAVNQGGRRKGAACAYLESLARGHTGIPGPAQEHRRRTAPHPRHEHLQLGAGPADGTGGHRGFLDAAVAGGRSRPARPDGLRLPGTLRALRTRGAGRAHGWHRHARRGPVAGDVERPL